MHLLDVNLLIALCDADHVHRPVAKRWFQTHAASGWATCPITENAVLRVVGQPVYPGGPGSPAAVRPLLRQLCSLPGHQFWPDEVSILDATLGNSLAGVKSGQLTDLYLLSLAMARKARFVTLDRRVDPSLVRGGRRSLVRIGP
jgi:toxin-antitoxin system PIN domain toxin